MKSFVIISAIDGGYKWRTNNGKSGRELSFAAAQIAVKEAFNG